jgi:hypothetical protein
MDCATRFAFLVGTPSVTVPDTAATTARSTREQRPIRPSGKQLPARSLGIPRSMAPALAASLRPRHPFLWLPASQASSAWAPMVSLTSDSAITLMSSAMLTMPSSNLGISAPSPAISCILPICGYRPSTNPNFSN